MFGNTLEQYENVVGYKKISKLIKKARLLDSRVLNVNSTFSGGGVAEILKSLVPLSNQVGLMSEWRVIHGNSSFYNITKKMHNGLQGEKVTLSEEEKEIYLNVNKEYCSYTFLDCDYLVVHDPQPLPLLRYLKDVCIPTIWRLHIDISNVNEEIWNFIEKFVNLSDLIIVSRKEYMRKNLSIPQKVVSPAIDPLSSKNIRLEDVTVYDLLKKNNIPIDKPIITQVSRMDKWKDPEGVLRVYEEVKKKVDCRLLFCFNSATDDPEGSIILQSIKDQAKESIEKGDVLLVEGDDPFLVNAIQRFSSVIIQKSIREGFCLAVTEALWKGTPVVASNVGGIPSQIIDGETGVLIEPYSYTEFADWIEFLIKSEEFAKEMGRKAKNYVRENFLITRLLEDYLNIFEELI